MYFKILRILSFIIEDFVCMALGQLVICLLIYVYIYIIK